MGFSLSRNFRRSQRGRDLRHFNSRRMSGFLAGFAVVFVALALAACSAPSSSQSLQDDGVGSDKVHAVATFSILSDMVSEVGGDRVEVHNLVPIGTDPHDFEPLPEDLKAMSEADVLFYNGLNLEGGDSGWFSRLTKSVGQPDDVIFETSSGIEPLYISDEKGNSQENPHAFLNPVNGKTMVENVRDGLIAIDPGGEEVYTQNAAAYLEQLDQVDAAYREGFDAVSKENRTLVTSERAFQYMASEYGLEEGYVWAIDTDENGSPAQIKALIAFVTESGVPALFVESNVDRRPLETVSAETGVPIMGVVLSDEIGKPGEEGDTYLNYLRHNLEVITGGLRG